MFLPIVAWVFAVSFSGSLWAGLSGIRTRSLSALRPPIEWLYFSVVAATGIAVCYPYARGGLIGAGDAYFYALQVADMVTQLRNGIFPVLVGQSEYAFNGNVNTLRTAPYFTYFAGLLDLLTLRALPFTALLNLTILTSAASGALSAYAAIRKLAPTRRLAAALLGALYVASPAVIAPLMAHDMVPTFMTAPWLPLFWLGVVLSLQRVNDTGPLLLSIATLAVIWLAHPPIAVWLSLALLGAQSLRLVLVGGAPGHWWRPFAGAALLTGLVAGQFCSVSALQVNFSLDADAFPFVQENWLLPLRPFAMQTVGQLQFLQLGWSLWLICLTCLICLFATKQARPAGVFLAIGLVVAVLLMFYVPPVTDWLWSHVPKRLLDITNVWPEQRFYPIIAAAVVVWAGMTVSRLEPKRWSYAIVCCILGLGCAWSFLEVGFLQRHATARTQSAAASAIALQPENLVLMRTSYVLFGTRPGYFSDGWVDPEFECRILDINLEVLHSNATAILRSQNPTEGLPPGTPLAPECKLTLDRSRDWLLVFDFANPTASGELTLRGAVNRTYSLPSSGGPLAFGAGPDAAHTLVVRAAHGATRDLTLASSGEGVSVRAIDFREHSLPVQIESLSPYRAHVQASQAGYLETPQVFIPGYTATVNGHDVTVRRSPEGLVAVPISPGDSAVEIRYSSPTVLRIGGTISLCGFLGLAVLAFSYRPGASHEEINQSVIRKHNLFAAWWHSRLRQPRSIATATVIVAVGAIIWWQQAKQARKPTSGSLRLMVELPRSSNQPEPLLVTGHTGAADCLYVTYTDGQHIQLGFDHWGAGGPISAPFLAIRGQPHTFDIAFGSDGKKEGILEVRCDGRSIFRQPAKFHPTTTGEIAIGRNSVGASVCRTSFTGRIVKVERIAPEFFH